MCWRSWTGQSVAIQMTAAQRSKTFSPAGEDLVICVDVKDFPMSVAEYSNNFDVDEHVEMWLEARQNGTAGVPPARILVHDAEDIEKMLLDLVDALATA